MTDNAAVVAVGAESRAITKPKPEPAAWRGRLSQHFRAPERKRLYGDVESARSELTKMIADPAVATGAWSSEAKSLLDRASQETLSGDLDCGWRFLHEAQRQTLFGFDLDRLLAQKLALRSEAEEKLQGWRKIAVSKLLDGVPDDAPLERQRTAVREATRIRDEHSDNVYFRFRLLRRQMVVISGALFTLVILFLFALANEPGLGEALRTRELTMPMFWVAMLLGGMGACFSALLTFATSSTELRIPAHLAGVWITATRPLIGAVSGAVALLLLKSGLMNLPADATPWIAPFLFGFSERLVMGAIGKAQKE